jgi:hypothetical protein
MSSIQTLIGKRFETILQELYPELEYVGDETNHIPDFEHPLFYAEAKVSLDKPDFAAHLKQYQIESFGEFETKKPVIYLVGFHNFSDSMRRLSGLSQIERELILTEEMNLVKLYVVDNSTITNIWKMRNYICQKGHIHDCTVRESHLKQIIDNSRISLSGEDYDARAYFQVPLENYLFCPPEINKDNIRVGHILPDNLHMISDYFHKC